MGETLGDVAGYAEELEIGEGIGAVVSQWNDVVDGVMVGGAAPEAAIAPGLAECEPVGCGIRAGSAFHPCSTALLLGTSAGRIGPAPSGSALTLLVVSQWRGLIAGAEKRVRMTPAPGSPQRTEQDELGGGFRSWYIAGMSPGEDLVTMSCVILG